jgi:hypothetical protein
LETEFPDAQKQWGLKAGQGELKYKWCQAHKVCKQMHIGHFMYEQKEIYADDTQNNQRNNQGNVGSSRTQPVYKVS